MAIVRPGNADRNRAIVLLSVMTEEMDMVESLEATNQPSLLLLGWIIKAGARTRLPLSSQAAAICSSLARTPVLRKRDMRALDEVGAGSVAVRLSITDARLSIADGSWAIWVGKVPFTPVGRAPVEMHVDGTIGTLSTV